MLAGEETVKEVSARYGVSRQSAYRYSARYRAAGREGLKGRKRGSKRGPQAGHGQWHRRIMELRERRPTWGARKLLWQLQQEEPQASLPAERTVQRWLLAAGQVRTPRRRPQRSGPTVVEPRPALRANDVWTIDFKGWYLAENGERVEPLTVRDLATRYILAAEPLAQRTEQAVREACERLFRKHGLPRVIRVDLGTPFCGAGPYGLTALSLWWHRLGIRVEFVQRRHGINNNAHEQMHRVLKAEAVKPGGTTRQSHARQLRSWQRDYNEARPHQALGMQPPAWLYRRSARRYRQPAQPCYPKHWPVRQVRSRGQVELDGRTRQIGRAYRGLPVGFKPVRGGYAVYCGDLFLGTVQPGLHPHLRPSTLPLYLR